MVHYYTHRTYCDCLSEMRSILSHTDNRDKEIMLSLIEELQVYGNRMEAGLSYMHDIHKLHEERKKLLVQINKLKGELSIEEDD